MGFWKKQQPANTPATPKSARPASRQHADDIRRKAQRYTELTEQPGDLKNDRRKATRQREQAEREMAALRAETMQARHLAGQIENLHQPTRVQRKGRIMSTSIADPGQAQRMTRRNTDKPSPAGGQLNFNPLHPSMELPPEQLIRLLGLENKTKRRRKQPKPVVATPARKTSSTDTTPVSKPVKLSLPKTTPASAERERDTVALPFGDSSRRLIIPALAAGAVAGIAISAYLFWGAPEDTTPPVAKTAPAPKTKRVAPLPKTIKPAPVPVPATAPAAITRQSGTVRRDNAMPQIEIEAEEKRLRNEAEQRFAERATAQGTRSEQDVLNADTALPAATEPDVGRYTFGAMPSGSPDAASSPVSDEPSAATIIDEVTVPASGVAETPTFTEEPFEVPTTSNEQPPEATTPPEPAIRAPQTSASQSEVLPEQVPTEQETVRAATIPAEQPVPDVQQDGAPGEAVNEALF